MFVVSSVALSLFLSSCRTPGMGINSKPYSDNSKSNSVSLSSDSSSDLAVNSSGEIQSDSNILESSESSLAGEDTKGDKKVDRATKEKEISDKIRAAELAGDPFDGSEMESLRIPNYYDGEENPWVDKKDEYEEMWKSWENPIDPDMKKLRGTMVSTFASYMTDPKTYAMAYMDLTTGQVMTINGDASIRAASAAKLFLGMYMSELVYKGYFDWDEKFQVQFSTDWIGDIGAISVGPDYATYHLERLMYCMLTQSDNAATSCISRQWVLRSPSHDYEQDLNYRFGFNYHINHEIQPNRAILGLKDLYEDKDGIYKRMKTEFMPNNVDNNSTVNIYSSKTLHKTGYAYGNINDFGIVYSKYPYAYVFMTTGEVPGAEEVLTYIGLKLYQEHVNRTEGYVPEW